MKINFKLIKKYFKQYNWLLLVPIFLYAFYLNNLEQADIDIHTTEAAGKVYKLSSVYKRHSKRKYHYEFYYQGQRYIGKETAYRSKNIKIGNYYIVEFSSENSNHNRILFDKPLEKE